jgi:hypothetical protein
MQGKERGLGLGVALTASRALTQIPLNWFSAFGMVVAVGLGQLGYVFQALGEISSFGFCTIVDVFLGFF